jgi:ABC-type sulfate/molybdate transport systems ATPase subunit
MTVTALLTTHDPTLMDIADSVLHLTDGTILQESQAWRVPLRPAPGGRARTRRSSSTGP